MESFGTNPIDACFAEDTLPFVHHSPESVFDANELDQRFKELNFGNSEVDIQNLEFMNVSYKDSFFEAQNHPYEIKLIESNFEKDLKSAEEDASLTLNQNVTDTEGVWVSTTESDGDGKKPNGRGRPRQILEMTSNELVEYITQLLKQEVRGIEETIDEEIKGTRRRDDKPRTKLVRLVKKIPDMILKKLVSVGDYKHRNLGRLSSSYQKAFLGLISLLQSISNNGIAMYTNTQADTLRTFMEDLEILDDMALCQFCGIKFPKQKVRKVSGLYGVDGDIIKQILKSRDGTSVKQLKNQLNENRVLRPLFILANTLVSDDTEFPKSTQILRELSML